MQSKIIFITIIFFIISVIALLTIVKNTYTTNLISPVVSKLSTQNANEQLKISPSPTPKVFKFDKNTNLEIELETVNSEVLDDDFGQLEQLIKSI